MSLSRTSVGYFITEGEFLGVSSVEPSPLSYPLLSRLSCAFSVCLLLSSDAVKEFPGLSVPFVVQLFIIFFLLMVSRFCLENTSLAPFFCPLS